MTTYVAATHGTEPAAVLVALADPTRRRILELLANGERPVSQIASQMPVSRPAVSQHLAVLERAGLVAQRREGTRRLYRVEGAGLQQLQGYLQRIWGDALEAFRDQAQRSQEEAMRTEEVTQDPVKESPSTSLEPLHARVDVPLAPERAFELFTTGIGTWWPLDTHSVGGERTSWCAFEPAEVDGRLIERWDDGTEREWGRVLVWEPPERLVFTWHPGRGPAGAQEVEVRFHPSPGGCSVELEHRGWEHFGEGAQEMRAGYRDGWAHVLGEKFAAAARRGSALAQAGQEEG